MLEQYNGNCHIMVTVAGFFILGLIVYIVYNVLKHDSQKVKL